jgi:hypothetical protein
MHITAFLHRLQLLLACIEIKPSRIPLRVKDQALKRKGGWYTEKAGKQKRFWEQSLISRFGKTVDQAMESG